MTRIQKFYSHLWITIIVGLLAMGGGFVLAQARIAHADQEVHTLDVPIIPNTFNYQGTLRNSDGSLFNGTTKITANIYNVPTDGSSLHTETFNNVAVRDGVFNIVLGDQSDLGDTMDNAPVYIGISVGDNSELIPRERIHAVPWAIHATDASHAADADFATAADTATNADHANSANTATSATNATNAQFLTNFNYANNYSTGDTTSAAPGFQNMTVWQNNPNDMVCFLTSVQGSINPFNIGPSCTIDQQNQTLSSGPYSFCSTRTASSYDPKVWSIPTFYK